MSDSVIIVENLSKRYLVGHQAVRGDRYITLRDSIMREMRSFAHKSVDAVRGRQIVQGDEVEEFWALKNVSFEVQQGEVIGIIGRNGAGKSTLLKIIARITEPTEGRVVLHGRVASLLEVGTGFHPELTGRENIYLNGAILGMSRAEIDRKFNEIMAFAEVERFLDTPVKHYSSGMYVRLAFAVAAHLEPEILIVDEVLAVGDAIFQEKCLGKMKDVAAGGRTVLFISHNMSAILQLTDRAILLSNGTVDFVGPSAEAVNRYLHGYRQINTSVFDVRNTARHHEGTGDVRILSLRFDRSLPYYEFLEPIRYIVRIQANRAVERLRIGMTVIASDGTPVGNSFSPEVIGLAAGEECELTVTLASFPLAPGHYYCGVSAGRGDHRGTITEYDVVTDTLFFEVGPERTQTGSMASWIRGWGSIVFPDLRVDRKLMLKG
jgi:lipopolysaccharide transport system ATP-binding protein